MAFGAIAFGRQAKRLLAIVTGRAILVLAMVRLGHFHFFLHLEDFCMAGVTFRIRHFHVCFMAEEHRSLLLGFILYIPSAHFLLSEGCTQSHKTYDADADDENPPEFITHFLTSFTLLFSLNDFLPANPHCGCILSSGNGSVKKKQKDRYLLSLTGSLSEQVVPFERGLQKQRLFFFTLRPENANMTL